jgi:hypothetical protein
MYTVIIHARGSDLADLIGLVGTMKEARLVSASLQEQQQPEAVVAKKRRGPAKRAEATDGDDPRLVFNIRPTGAKKVDVQASLKRLGLTEEWLRSNVVKTGTAEHSVKMAVLRNKFFTEKNGS